jgi:hypothetical protein
MLRAAVTNFLDPCQFHSFALAALHPEFIPASSSAFRGLNSALLAQ